jgi:citrate synthase
MHGPIEEAYALISNPGMDRVGLLPGWGNSFIKGQIDPEFLRVDQTIEATAPRIHSRLREVTDQLHSRGKRIFPNPGAYTAAVALILGMPSHVAPMLFVQARLEAWTELFHRVVVGEREKRKEAA